MLSSIFAWIVALFFLFLAGSFMVWALKRENITPSECIERLAFTIWLLALAWVAAGIGGV